MKLPRVSRLNAPRNFTFGRDTQRADIGRCTAYWTLSDGRECISELSIDRATNIFETYFFSSHGIETVSTASLFDAVKTGHLRYDHDDDIRVEARTIADDYGEPCWAVEVLIAQATRLVRKRPPFYQFHLGIDAPLASRWSALKGYIEAQRDGVPFLLVEGETGSASWGDSDVCRITPVDSDKALLAKLREQPNERPKTDYTRHNIGVIDARDFKRPFSHLTYRLAKDWIS